MTVLLGDWPTDWIIYSWFIHRLTDSLVTGSLFDQIIVFTVQELTNWLNDSIDWLISWLYCPGTDQLTEWFMAGLLVDQLTLLSEDWPTHWMIYSWLIYWISDSTVQGLTIGPKYLWVVGWVTIWLNDLLLVDWLNTWLYCPGPDQLTEWFIADWLFNYSCSYSCNSNIWGLTNWLNALCLVYWLNYRMYCPGTNQATEWFMAD